MGLLLLFLASLGVVFGLAVFLYKHLEKKHTLKTYSDFEKAFEAYDEGHKSSVLMNELSEMKYLPKLEGFQSVITLLKYRHRGRSRRRLEELLSDWQNGEL